MRDDIEPANAPLRFVVPPPRVTVLGLAWLVAVFALCNAWAVLNLRQFAAAGRTAAQVDRIGARLLAAANLVALAVGLYVYGRPRIGRGLDRGWTGRAAARALRHLLMLLIFTVIQMGLARPDALREAARGYVLWAGIAGAAGCTAWGLVVAARSLRGPRPEKP